VTISARRTILADSPALGAPYLDEVKDIVTSGHLTRTVIRFPRVSGQDLDSDVQLRHRADLAAQAAA
jgi:hypothetical protein